MSEQLVRVTARIDRKLLAKVKKEAEKKRWSLNVFIEEALISATS